MLCVCVCVLTHHDPSMPHLSRRHAGHLSPRSSEAYVAALLPYFLDPSNLFVISR